MRRIDSQDLIFDAWVGHYKHQPKSSRRPMSLARASVCFPRGIIPFMFPTGPTRLITKFEYLAVPASRGRGDFQPKLDYTSGSGE